MIADMRVWKVNMLKVENATTARREPIARAMTQSKYAGRDRMHLPEAPAVPRALRVLNPTAWHRLAFAKTAFTGLPRHR